MLGRPWEADGLHCWALVRDAATALFGVVLPPVLDVAPAGRLTKAELFNTHPERANWVEVDRPGRWAVCLMHRRRAREELLEHAGIYLDVDGGGILHVDDPHGVVFDTPFELPRLRKWAAPLYLVPRVLSPGRVSFT